ncbi:MAG: hypothetical protein BGO92_17750 [Magnetospirillum sp. 64-120]|nr:MAG: hypothetical protein BGO92_17750 [Magnetospirillum sp. 64-120]
MWLEGHFSQAIALRRCVETRSSPVRVPEQLMEDVYLWCARFDSEWRRRERYRRYAARVLQLILSSLSLMLVAALCLWTELDQFWFLEPLRNILNSKAMLELLVYILMGVGISVLVVSLISLVGAYLRVLSPILRLLLWSPLSLMLIVLGSGLLSADPPADPNLLPDYLVVNIHLKKLAVLIGFAIPILVNWRKTPGLRLTLARTRKFFSDRLRKAVVKAVADAPEPSGGG